LVASRENEEDVEEDVEGANSQVFGALIINHVNPVASEAVRI